MRILIVGGGITGAVVSSLIKSTLPRVCDICVWEKCSSAGGRMCTSVHGTEPWFAVDLGAQYISPTLQEYEDHNVFYRELEECGLLVPRSCKVEGEKQQASKHFVSPNGMSTLVKHYLLKSGANVHYNTPLSGAVVQKGKFLAQSFTGREESFDCIVLTMPVPEILHLGGDIPSLIDSVSDIRKGFNSVAYSSRYALGLFFDVGARIQLGWDMKYFDDPVIRFISVDDQRRGVELTGLSCQSLVVHTTVPFGVDMANSEINDVCYNAILPRLFTMLPQMPKPAFVIPKRWNYSQVLNGYSGSSGAVTIFNNPLLVVGGDALTYSKFDGCLTSAVQVVKTVAEFLME